ncbi:MAG: hypothetical protein HYX61_05060 [Gammaproteobacteria bacterium]|jgi:hypothetical protein|nr:hypothetical protein [Gammaproteobacteria bacterium]
MSNSKIMKMGRDATISPNMMLLHLRWQQIRLELLQQASQQSSLPESTSSNHIEEHKKGYIAA